MQPEVFHSVLGRPPSRLGARLRRRADSRSLDGPKAGSASVTSELRTIALARFPGLIRDAARDFERLTGLRVVTTLGSASPNRRTVDPPSPPIHPLCAKALRQIDDKTACHAEWRKHMQSAAKMVGPRIHTCPLGLRCAGVPIVLGEHLLGLAKLVAGPEVPDERFHSLARLLDVFVAKLCQELFIPLLVNEIASLRASVRQLRRIKRPYWPDGHEADRCFTNRRNSAGTLRVETLVSRILDYVSEHYSDQMLSLNQVARAVDKNEKYVAHLFAQHVGLHMRAYVTTLRVQRACELLLQTSRPIEEVAQDSGFARLAQFRRSFRRAVGVTASEYRQIFGVGR